MRTISDEDIVARRVVVRGRVQGVFFRDTCRREAQRLNVAGGVRNEPDGTVTAEFEGQQPAVEAVIAWTAEGPRHAVVDRVDVETIQPSGRSGFYVA